MRVRCLTCGTDDIPETNGMHRPSPPGNGTAIIEGDTTINDHISIWHPNEFVRVEGIKDGVWEIRATGDFLSSGGSSEAV